MLMSGKFENTSGRLNKTNIASKMNIGGVNGKNAVSCLAFE